MTLPELEVALKSNGAALAYIQALFEKNGKVAKAQDYMPVTTPVHRKFINGPTTKPAHRVHKLDSQKTHRHYM